MTINKVQLLSVPVSDQDRARDFYVDVLGLELLADTEMGPDMRWVMVSPPGAPNGTHSRDMVPHHVRRLAERNGAGN